MFGFGRSAELDRREQALNMREQELNQRENQIVNEEKNLQLKIYQFHEQQIKLQEQLEDANNEKDLYRRERLVLLNTKAYIIEEAKSAASKLLNVAKKEAEVLKNQGYQEGKLEGLQSGKKSYWDMEKERDAALKKASNARHAAIRRHKKALRAPKPITLFSNK